jgi:hypothetical protein
MRASAIRRADAPGLSTSTGSVEMHAQSAGGYWTRYLADGTYFDSVGQVTHYGNRYRDSYGNDASQNGFGIALSQEAGKPFGIGATPIAIEPQAQLMYQYLKLNGFNDSVSAVSGTTSHALRGRLGVRMFRPNLGASALGAATPYFTADVLHDFVAGPDRRRRHAVRDASGPHVVRARPRRDRGLRQVGHAVRERQIRAQHRRRLPARRHRPGRLPLQLVTQDASRRRAPLPFGGSGRNRPALGRAVRRSGVRYTGAFSGGFSRGSPSRDPTSDSRRNRPCGRPRRSRPCP